MTIKSKKRIEVSLNLDEKTLPAIQIVTRMIDLITDFIAEETCGNGDINSFVALYYDDNFNDFLFSFLEKLSTIEKEISQYINNCLEERQVK